MCKNMHAYMMAVISTGLMAHTSLSLSLSLSHPLSLLPLSLILFTSTQLSQKTTHLHVLSKLLTSHAQWVDQLTSLATPSPTVHTLAMHTHMYYIHVHVRNDTSQVQLATLSASGNVKLHVRMCTLHHYRCKSHRGHYYYIYIYSRCRVCALYGV